MENPYVVITQHDGYLSYFSHWAWGKGRARRRRLGVCGHVPQPSDTTLPSVLRAVAADMDLPPGQRWRPLF